MLEDFKPGGQPESPLSLKFLKSAMSEIGRATGTVLQCGSGVETFILGRES